MSGDFDDWYGGRAEQVQTARGESYSHSNEQPVGEALASMDQAGDAALSCATKRIIHSATAAP